MYGLMLQRMLPLMHVARHGSLEEKMNVVLEIEAIVNGVRAGTTPDDYRKTMAMVEIAKAAIKQAQKESEDAQ